MEENEDILCVLPRGGPPTKDRSLHQGTHLIRLMKKRALFIQKLYQSALLNSPGKISKFAPSETALVILERTDQEQVVWKW